MDIFQKTPKNFSLEIEKMASEKSITHLDAVLHYCEVNEVEIETVSKLITKALKSKIEAAVGPLLDRMSQAYKLFKTMKSAWYENLSEKSLVFQSWQGRVDVGASLVDFLSQSTRYFVTDLL